MKLIILLFVLLIHLNLFAEKGSFDPTCPLLLNDSDIESEPLNTKSINQKTTVTINVRLGLVSDAARINELHLNMERMAERYNFDFNWRAVNRSAVITISGEEDIVIHFSNQYERAFYSGSSIVFGPLNY